MQSPVALVDSLFITIALMSTHSSSSAGAIIKWSGLLAGPLLALLAYFFLPQAYEGSEGKMVEFTAAGRATLALMIWMAVWWLTEAVDIEVTALLPLATFGLLGISSMKAAAAPYADDTIFLFMGGFLLALSMQRWGLDRRIALITLRMVGTKPANMVAGFMIATSLLSAFVSNTATAAMMMPIAMSVIALIEHQTRTTTTDGGVESAAATEKDVRHLSLALLLGIAYSASIAGIATIIGTPPNVILVGFLKETIDEKYRMDISFYQWLKIGIPLTIVFLPLVWLILTRLLFPVRMQQIEGGHELIDREYRKLGKPNRGEIITFIVFMLTALLWITRPWLSKLGWGDGENRTMPLKGLTDAGIAMLAGLVLFVTPVNRAQRLFTMNWATAAKLPWGILILFGGGLSLAAAVQANGVAQFIGSQTTIFQGASPLVIVIVITTMVIFLTELTSNTATTAALLPVMAALAPGLNVHPYLLAFPTAIAASCAFMLPVATPPNAIVFASGHVTIAQMCKAGFWLNIIGIVLVTLLTMLVLGPALGVDLFA